MPRVIIPRCPGAMVWPGCRSPVGFLEVLASFATSTLASSLPPVPVRLSTSGEVSWWGVRGHVRIGARLGMLTYVLWALGKVRLYRGSLPGDALDACIVL